MHSTPYDFDRKAFQPITLDRTGMAFDLSRDEFPTQVFTVVGDSFPLGSGHTHYVMVTDGWAMLSHAGKGWALSAGMFAVVPGLASIDAEQGKVLVITRLDYLALFQIGGPLEPRGRLRYIDGCSDTLLVGPPVVGEPCLNHLHMPVGTNQTQHTHPSSRIGVIMGGEGECRTPNATIPLRGGMGWFIPAGCEHSFFTFDQVLDVVAWHPDTDQGPSHESHPMANRTYVGDQSVAGMEHLRTKEIVG